MGVLFNTQACDGSSGEHIFSGDLPVGTGAEDPNCLKLQLLNAFDHCGAIQETRQKNSLRTRRCGHGQSSVGG